MTTTSLSKLLMLCCLVSAWTWTATASSDEISSLPVATTNQPRPDQATLNETTVEFNKDYFKGYVTDFTAIVTAPARWDSSDWIKAGIFTGIAIGLYENDAKIRQWVLDHKTTTTNTIGDDVTDVGFGKYTLVVLGGMYAYGYAAEDGKMRKTSLLAAESFILTGVFVQTLKFATGRHRPYTEDGPRYWEGPGIHRGDAASFPGGHASSTFSIATVIASEYDNIIVPTLAYGIATVTALNRVAHDAHWSSDVFVGSAIGYVTGKAVVASHRNGRGNNLSLSPLLLQDGNLGMVLTYRF